MFRVKSDKEIGEKLRMLIIAKYKKIRRFCIKYLELEGMPKEEDEIRKMENRMSQILKGSKAIQTYDLPIFTELLGVTCEEILSAGEYCVQKNHRVTNYSIAFSNDPKDWEEYIKREDKLILNPDEYNKTVIDYAIESGNYKLIKYLMDKKYIWLVDDSQRDPYYFRTFGAGTSIERRKIYMQDLLQLKLASEDKLRMDIIALAVANNDFEALNELKAREIPLLYNIVRYGSWNCVEDDNVYDPSKLVNIIADASDEIIEYFTTPFKVTDSNPPEDFEARSYTFVFPFYSELLAELIKRDHKYTEFALRTAIEHNKVTYEQLKKQIEESVNADMKYYDYLDEKRLAVVKNDLRRGKLKDIKFGEKLQIVNFSDFYNGLITRTNIIKVSVKSSILILNHLIDDLNLLHNKIIHISNEYENTDKN